jgi:hypothetical protein
MRELLRREVARLAKASGRNMSDELNRIIENGLRAEDIERQFSGLKEFIAKSIGRSSEAGDEPPRHIEGRALLQLDDLRASLRQMQACILDADDTSIMVAFRISRRAIHDNRHLIAAISEAGAEWAMQEGRPLEETPEEIEDRTKAATES